MESEQSSLDSSSDDTDPPSNAPIDHALEGVKLTPQDVHILKGYLEDFEKADTQTWNRILEKAMGDVYHLRPANSAFNKKDAKQKIRKWFYNHYSAPHRQIIKLTRKWSARNAFYQAKREDIMCLAKEVSGGAPGSREFLGALQDATTQLWKDLPIEEQERYADIAKEWSEHAPPKEIQAKMASAGVRGQIVRDFQTQLYKTCGVRCIVLIASEKADGTPQVALDEWNSRLDDGQNFTDFFLQWRNTDLWKQWKRYSRMCFATDGDQPAEKDRSKTLKAPIPIITDSNGLPAIPSITRGGSINTKVVQTTLRNYCTAHIRSVSGRAQATIPWAKITINPTSWIDEGNPSKSVIGHADEEIVHLMCYVPSGRINPTWIWDRFAEYTRRRSSVSRRRRLGRYAGRDQGQGAKAQEREGIPQDIKAKGFVRERPSTYTTRAGAFKPSNPNTQPQTLISQSNQRPYKSAVTSVTYHTPIRAQAHPDPSGPALGGSRASRWETRLDVPPSVVMLLSHRPKRADVVLFKELLGHLGHKRNMMRMLTTPEPGSIGEASNVSPPSQAPQPVQQCNHSIRVSESEEYPDKQPTHLHELGIWTQEEVLEGSAPEPMPGSSGCPAVVTVVPSSVVCWGSRVLAGSTLGLGGVVPGWNDNPN
ncbi:hypothetical protein EDB83DRAFT_2322736 [Lactarius deliciosus]|nr:hypothetical protein EDB83DRAFT_2322736 [Lactarius deliciosus]